MPSVDYMFPASAGMIPDSTGRSRPPAHVPRKRGDDPNRLDHVTDGLAHVPRKRGDDPGRSLLPREMAWMFPASAGMIPAET